MGVQQNQNIKTGTQQIPTHRFWTSWAHWCCFILVGLLFLNTICVALPETKYNKNKLSAAHKTLPFGTKVRVYNPANKKFVDVVINDRGPFIKGRIIELSRKAAQQINLIKAGVAQVEITIIHYNNSVAVSNKSSINMIVKAQDMETGGLYKMQVLKLKAKGFGVQVAGYTDYQSVVQQLAVFQDNFFKGSTVFVDQKDGKPYYKIILGPLNTRAEATSYCTSIKEKYKIMDAFVVNIEELAAKK